MPNDECPASHLSFVNPCPMPVSPYPDLMPVSPLSAAMLFHESNPIAIDVLSDIVSKVKIESDFCISHPDYDFVETSAKVVAQIKQLPVDFQNRYLSQQLGRFIDDIYYQNYLSSTPEPETSSDSSLLENNTMTGLNLEFYEQLAKSNCGEGYFDPGWYVLRQESDGSLAVQKNDLTVHIKRDRHLQPTERSAIVGEVVAIKMPPNLIDEEFYIAVGNAGLVESSDPEVDCQPVNIYFNLSPEGAIAVMGSLTRQLNNRGIPFTFKVLYDPDDYEGYDTGVLHFERNNYESIRQVLQTVYRENQCYFRASVPLFTKLLAPGLSLAEEPDCKFTPEESFGKNRCRIVANGLLEAKQKGEESPETRMASIEEEFSRLGIELQRPYLNGNSEDIYMPLVISH